MSQADPSLSARPNVLWVFGDQHRGQALGHRGDPNLCTPNIDRLAASGLSFPQAVGGCPLCGPYRGALLTGRYPHQSVPGHEHPIPEGMPTVADAFNKQGYHTAWFGKWHVAGWHERDGRAAHYVTRVRQRGGFRQWLGYENNNAQWDCYVHGHRDDGSEVAPYRLPGFETDALTDLTIGYLQQRAKDGQPFFCGLSVQPPHDPYQAPERWSSRHAAGRIVFRANVPDVAWIRQRAAVELAGYYAMIENLDWNLGRLMDELDRLGLADSTHIVFFSDHGDMHGSHGLFRKANPYEESIRVPFILGSARLSIYGLRRGECDCPVNHVDVAPTSLGLCGLNVPEWMQGTDYSPRRLHDARADPRHEPDSAYLQLVIPTRHPHSTDRPWRGIVTRDGWKYVCLEHQPWLLFNLNDDPYEQVNLAHNTVYKADRARLQERLARWIRDTQDRFPLPQDI